MASSLMDRFRRAMRKCFGCCFFAVTNRKSFASEHGKASFTTTFSSPDMAGSKDFDMRSFSPTPLSPATIRPQGRLSSLPAESIRSPRSTSPFMPDIELPVRDGFGGSAHAFLHLPDQARQSMKTAVILLPGASGGVAGPSRLYLGLSTKLCSLKAPVPVLRLDYRFPGRTTPCVADTKAAMNYMQTQHGVEHFILVGWAFGSAPALTLAGKDGRVIGAAGIASQTADGMTGIREAGRRSVPVLLLHGTGDKSLDVSCSKNLYQSYWEGYKGEEDKASLVLFEDDDHRLSMNAKLAEEYIAGFVADCTGHDACGIDVRGEDANFTEAKLGKDGRMQ